MEHSGKQWTKLKVRPPLTSMEGVKLHRSTIQCTKANDKSSGMVATPSRTQSITMYTNRQIMQPTLGFRLKISTSEVRIKGVMQTLHRIWRRWCRHVGKHRKAQTRNKEW